ncbi:hypothetical protein ASG07_01045 [Sphingomonas sp. Leaf343]|nr:hypothetical protein ASG07_01045 [Sphingomonas sp. Leaf343]
MGCPDERPGVDDGRGATMLIGHSVSDADGRILTMDQALCDLLQRSERELAGLSYADFTHPGDVPRNRRAVDALLVGQGPLRLRKRYVRADGVTLWCDVHVSRFTTGFGGRLVGTIHHVGQDALTEGPARLWRAAREADRMMRRRRAELGDDLFADHAWAIMLNAYLAEAEGRLIRLPDVAEQSGISTGMAERWTNALEAKGYLDQRGGSDGIVQLSQAGVARVERLLVSSSREAG